MIRVLCLDGPWVGQVVKRHDRRPFHTLEPKDAPVAATRAPDYPDPDGMAISYVTYTPIEVRDAWGPLGGTFVAHTKAVSEHDLRGRSLWNMVFDALDGSQRTRQEVWG